MENNFVKVHSNRDIFVSALILVAGIVLIFVNNILGIVIILCGLLFFLLHKSGYKFNNQGFVLQKKSIELSRKCQQSVLDFLNGQNKEPHLIKGNEGTAYAQVSVFQDLDFRKITEIIELNSSDAQILIEKI